MARRKRCEFERIVGQLTAEGWKQQRWGATYLNGTLGVHLLKDGEVITVLQDFAPDEEFVDQEWPASEDK